MRIIISLIIVVLFSVDCTRQEVISTLEIDFINAVKKDTFFIEDYFESNMISLKNNTGIILENIESVYLSNNIYIYDKSHGGKLFMFDEHNNELNDITRIGKGPAEYPFISYVFVDSNIYVGSGPSLYIFNKKNELVAKHASLDMQSHAFVIHDGLMYCSYNFGFKFASRYSELSLFNFEDDERKPLLPFVDLGEDQDGKIRTSIGQCLTVSQDEEVLFSRLYENIIYKINDDQIEEKYLINLPGTDGYLLRSDQKYSGSFPKYMLIDFIESSTNLYLNISDFKSREKHFLVYDRDLGKSERYNTIWSRDLRTRVIIDKICNDKIIGSINVTKVTYLVKKAKRILLDSDASSEDIEWASFIINIAGEQVNPILLIMNERN